jgi:putative FmdB family regulatory protein
MPVYDYRCAECQKTYDVYHKGKEMMEDIVCPSCGSKNHTKLMSVPSIRMGTHTDAAGGGSCESGGCCGGACGLN